MSWRYFVNMASRGVSWRYFEAATKSVLLWPDALLSWYA
jgi:hypothetical protein